MYCGLTIVSHGSLRAGVTRATFLRNGYLSTARHSLRRQVTAKATLQAVSELPPDCPSLGPMPVCSRTLRLKVDQSMYAAAFAGRMVTPPNASCGEYFLFTAVQFPIHNDGLM